MINLATSKINKATQCAISISLVCVVALLSYLFSSFIEYRVVAFILLVTVSLIAMVFDIIPVLITAAFSALIWDFFFIPPHFTLQISSTEDVILLLMYFVIVLFSGVLTYKIRQIEKIALQKEEKANTVKLYNTLLNSLSHELRTPIATIIAATDNFQFGNDKLTPLQKNELISEISKASFRLNQQVDNLLNMSRLDSGFIKPKKDWCDVEEVIYNSVHKIEESKNTQKITINVNPAIPLFKLDKGMLEQVLYNLLNNAVIYTDVNCKIDISAACYTDTLQIVIEDDGQGFPADEIKKVFDKFYRLHNSKAGGTGLGLSIVKGFVEAMNGRIDLENKVSGGARFTITINAETSYLKNLKNE